uniref:UBN2 domain-containing protein n=1 Tax=Tanacetum cinerariifolium TaxID=118510 RepID=A0A6L2J8K3_TANCI|nr:UBN2 domain-containing protein [Tanacetum cinerariifolium]
MVPFEQQDDDLKKKLAKNNEAKMVHYKALPRKEYERIFMCKMAKDIRESLLITHQEESIDSDSARFNTIITSLKALDEGFSSKNYVRKFLRALHPKWRAKVTPIEESKDLSSLALDELIDNLKVHEVVMEKDSEIHRGKKEKVKSIALKGKKESSDDETSTSGSDDEEYAVAVRNFKKFFRRKDAVIQIISLAIVQNHLATKIKRPSLEVLGAIAKMMSKIKPTMKLISWINRRMSANSLREMLNNQKLPSRKIGLAFDDSKASTSRTKNISFVGSSVEKATDGSTIKVHGSTLPGSVRRTFGEKETENVFSPHMSSRSDFVITRKKLIHNSIDESKKPSLKPSPKSDIEVYVAQPLGFIDFQKPNYVYKLKKALYGLKQALKACQSKYIKEMLKKFGLEDSKPTKTPKSTEIKLTKDDEADSVDSSKYREDNDACMIIYFVFWVQIDVLVVSVERCDLRIHHMVDFDEQLNKRTPSSPPQNKSLSPPQAPLKSISSKGTHYTSSSSPKLPPRQMSPKDPYVQTMDNWPSGPSNPSSPPHVSRPPPSLPNPPPEFEPFPLTQPLFVNIKNNIPLLHNNAHLLENIHHPPPNLRNQDFPNPSNILDFVHPNDMAHLHNMFCQCCRTTSHEIQML